MMDYESRDGCLVVLWLRSKKKEDPKAMVLKAQPHFLVTEFVSEDTHKSTWVRKVPTFFGLKKKLAAARIKEVLIKPDTVTDVFYDSGFKVIETRVRPKVSKPSQ